MSIGRAYAELTFASALWGFGFIATRWGMEGLGPVWLQAVRYALVVSLAFPFWYFRKNRKPAAQALRIAAVPGIALGLTLLFQTYGLQYTTVTKSGFLTTLYVIIVPLIETIVRRKAPQWRHISCVFLALIGTAFMTGMGPGALGQEAGMAAWNVGDLLTLACAMCAAVQILALGRLASQLGPFEFNFFQSVWSGLIPVALALGWTAPPSMTAVTSTTVAGVLFLALGSTLLGFHIQIRAQRVISPSLASFFFLLESPFAALFAAYFFGERLSSTQWMGAALIFFATAGSLWPERGRRGADTERLNPGI